MIPCVQWVILQRLAPPMFEEYRVFIGYRRGCLMSQENSSVRSGNIVHNGVCKQARVLTSTREDYSHFKSSRL